MTEKSKSAIKKYWKVALGIVLGGGLGATYAYFVGCSTGGCPLTSNPAITGMLGGFIGYTVASGLSTGDDKAPEK